MLRLRNYFITTISGCDEHTRTGLEILKGGGGYGSARIAPKARELLGGGSGGMLPQEVLKNRVFLMPFPEFWSRFFMHRANDNEKKVLGTLMKQN